MAHAGVWADSKGSGNEQRCGGVEMQLLIVFAFSPDQQHRTSLTGVKQPYTKEQELDTIGRYTVGNN
jgi:hypothetical protein